MNTQLKTVILKGLIFILILVTFDFGLGLVARFLFFTQKSGKFYRMRRVFYHNTSDLIIFGSSRSSHHYHPGVLDSMLVVNSYNAGAQGQQILYQKTVQKILLQNSRPRLIILDISPDWLYESEDAYDNLSELRPFWFRYPDIISPVLSIHSKLQKFWLYSKAYQYNSTIIHILYYFVKPQPDLKGYVPLMHVMTPQENLIENRVDSLKAAGDAGKQIDPVFENAFREFLLTAREKKINVVMICSPDLRIAVARNNLSLQRIMELGHLYNIPLLDFTHDPYMLDHKEFFNDTYHLNDAGARAFSVIVSRKLKDWL